MQKTKITEHFSREEFECKCGCGYNLINQKLVEKLERIRQIINMPMIVTSGCRCKDYNKKIGGSENSAHLRGEAADIMITSNSYRYFFLSYATILFGRIGIYQTHIHVDVATHLPNRVIWTGKIRRE